MAIGPLSAFSGRFLWGQGFALRGDLRALRSPLGNLRSALAKFCVNFYFTVTLHFTVFPFHVVAVMTATPGATPFTAPFLLTAVMLFIDEPPSSSAAHSVIARVFRNACLVFIVVSPRYRRVSCRLFA